MQQSNHLKSAAHHYFPKVLQKFWGDGEGWVHRLRSNGTQTASKSGSFGHTRNAHRIQIGKKPSAWDNSFEKDFKFADDNMAEVVDLIQTVESSDSKENEDWRSRSTPQWALQHARPKIAESIASLVVRSPCLRNLIRCMVQGFFGEPQYPSDDKKVPDHILAANLRNELERYSRALADRGKFFILISNSREFIFGDGLLHNFRTGGPVSPHNPRCIVPLSPTAAVFYDCPRVRTH